MSDFYVFLVIVVQNFPKREGETKKGVHVSIFLWFPLTIVRWSCIGVPPPPTISSLFRSSLQFMLRQPFNVVVHGGRNFVQHFVKQIRQQ